ncbi:MAG TPA: DUF1045 domain-containing protein [Candidatus Saccharimonadales bacterium]|nr:DUF1045 domain-containing protein [Candidatus Saccharimonadales bacterium]
MNSKPYDVVLLPDDNIVGKSIELSQKLSNRGVRFTLGNRLYFSHVSVYMLQLDNIGLEKATRLVQQLSTVVSEISARASEYHYFEGYLDIEYEKSAEISFLQEEIIKLLNPIRDGLREKDKERLATADEMTRNNIIKYGYRSVGESFYPHLTFTRFIKTDSQEEIMAALPDKAVFNGKFTGIGIFEIGDNGTCIKLVSEWPLKKLQD